jgi:Domain of unknown function (DUF4384)
MKTRVSLPFHLAGLPVALALAMPVAAQQSSGAPMPSVRILPDIPDPAPAAAAPAISTARLELLNSSVKVENAAGVSVDLIPNLEVLAGSKVGFRVTTKKPGYLILVDVDAAGKLTQIFPNTTTVTRSTREASNFIKPGRPLTIPQVGSADGAFDFVAELPAGVAMVVALLSDKPVQVVDLPNTPAPVTAPAEALRYVRDMTRSLKVPNDGGQLEQPNWSFDGKFYLIK